ncbi:F-box domain-containing protein [Fusarium falciforme]|uniref:F-box domain-containing protein n=1 Tax=Fusarium falciforme TaxID=195108 RepID=UPI002301728F|nr:F-box domain-containing protein [Fusarium falciforme]WAO84778.1 F-box domain-containing protein [Fusarium falciforme]
MDKLPPELLRRILLYLITEWGLIHEIHHRVPKTSLAAYAAISRKWQSIVETFTFQHLFLTPMRLGVAEAYNYLTPPRLAHLRHVRFEIEFPAHDLHVSTNPEDYDDQAVFNKAITQIFALVARVPRRQTPLISLTLLTWPSREHCIPWDGYRKSEKRKVFSGELRKTYLELSADWDRNIRDLSEVSFFRVELHSRALVFAPASINLMASKMTRLRKVEWRLCDAEKIDAELRIRQRTEFAHTLGILPRSIESLTLEYIREPPTDRTFQPPSIVPPDATSDILSQELRHFSQRDGLQQFLVDASVDSNILWPESQDPESKLPTWPNLSVFHVELNAVLPSGEWIQMRHPEAEEDEFDGNFDWDDAPYSEIPGEEYEKRFDCTYNPIHFERFALATARAASRMPKIKELYVTHHSMAAMGVGFVTRGLEESCCLEFTGDPHPEPSEEILDAWRKVVDLHGMEWNVHFAYGSDAYYLDTI